jgi:hypothetical protein
MKRLSVIMCIWFLPSALVQAGDPGEFWPEVNGFFGLSPQTRIFADAAFARGKESDALALDVAAYLDISLKPIRQRYRERDDWQRSRYVWLRIGYDHVFRSEEGVQYSAENRGIISLWHKFEFPEGVWLEARERADLRWIGGVYSTRFRFRLEATREFTVNDHTLVPYLNVEWFADTRYDGLARVLLQTGAEVMMTEHFRFELYLARQIDYLPSASGLYAIGIVAKWYY